MAFKGRKVADVYAELHLDRDSAQATLRGTSAALGADADRAGQELGKKMTDGLARAVEASSARLVKARRSEVDATNAVKVAELRLKEAREKGSRPASALLALENSLEKAQYRLSQAQSNTVTSTKKLEDAQRRLGSAMGDLGKDLGPGAQKAGDDAGGKLALGMRMSIIRNSPLIVAAIGGVLAAGAPLMTAAAVGLFAGIGIVAAAQSEKVQSAWLGTWQRVKSGAIADAAVIEPVLVRVADQVGDSFDRMRPRVRDAFSAAAPQIAVFTGGVLDLAENALPGLVRAVERGMPVTQGLAAFLAKTGTGLSDFFDRISAHGPAAGQVFSSLGDIMATLLPTLGELLGQGAELASVVLPMVSSSLGLVLSVVSGLGPALPVVVAGFTALKIAGALGGLFETFGGKLKSVGTYLATFVSGPGSATAATSALTSMKGAVGPLTAVIALAGAAFMMAKQQTNDWARALGEGGAAAEQARQQIAANESVYESGAGKLQNLIMGTTNWANALGVGTNASETAEQKTRDLFAAMDPLSQAQSKVAEWSATLKTRMEDESTSAGDLEAAKRRLAYWQSEAARLSAAEELAIRGVTQAMADQANQARSRVDAQFAYQESLNRIEDAQTAYNEALAEFGEGSEEAERAQLNLNEAMLASVKAFGEIAKADLPAALSDTQREIIGASAELTKLNGLIAQGFTLPPEMEAYRQQLIRITGQADGAMLAQAQLAAGIGELGYAITAVPGEKSITISAPTDELRQRLADLGFTITELPNGDITVVAETDRAKGNLGDLSTQLAGLNNTTATPTVDANTAPLEARLFAANAVLDLLGARKPLPGLDLATGPFDGKTQTSFNMLDVLGAQKPTPYVDLNTAPLDARLTAANAVLGWFGAQRPTPVGLLDTGPFAGNAGWMFNQLGAINAQRPSPIATLYADTTPAQAAINRITAARYSMTIVANLLGVPGGALGGKVGDVAARGFAGGGSPSRRSDGRISGPGGPVDDLVPAITNMGEPIRVANTEWVINAFVSGRQGDRKMAALNAGQADIVMRKPPARRFADGGTPNPVTGTGQTTERPNLTITGGVILQIPGAYNLGTGSDKRRLIADIAEGLVDYYRGRS